MVMGRTHIAGAGIAGLAAALAATAQGRAVTLYESAPQAGGRCRTVLSPGGFHHDNGTHVLFTANKYALRLIETIGAREHWIEPEPDGLPVWDAGSQSLSRLGLSPWSWPWSWPRSWPRSWLCGPLRPDGFGFGDFMRLIRLTLPLADKPVGAIMGTGPLAHSLIAPLTLAVLNTPVDKASARRLGLVLRRLARPGAARLLIARRGLTVDLIAPALALLRERGATIRYGERLRAIVQGNGRATALLIGERTIALGAHDRAILALPPVEIARLLPGLPVPEAYEPILNIHFRVSGPQDPRFFGLLGMHAQWALLREDHVSITISAADAMMDQDGETLAREIWREIVPALEAIGHPVDAAQVPPVRIVKERRATIRQAAGTWPQPPLRPLANLVLAGDWLTPLPATIESAVIAGERAAMLLAEKSLRSTLLFERMPFHAGGTP